MIWAAKTFFEKQSQAKKDEEAAQELDALTRMKAVFQRVDGLAAKGQNESEGGAGRAVKAAPKGESSGSADDENTDKENENSNTKGFWHGNLKETSTRPMATPASPPTSCLTLSSRWEPLKRQCLELLRGSFLRREQRRKSTRGREKLMLTAGRTRWQRPR